MESDVLIYAIAIDLIITRLIFFFWLKKYPLFKIEYFISPYILFVDHVVVGEVLLGLQGHQLVVVTDAHAGSRPLLLVQITRHLS